MSEYFLSESARADLEGIVDYTIERWGAAQAEGYLDEMIRCFERLAASPELGRRCDGLMRGLRRFEHGRHVIFYRSISGGIRIGRVLHQSALPTRLRLIDM